MLIEIYEAIFGCSHRKTTWPQSLHGSQPTVRCLSGCGKTFYYNWDTMKRGAEVSNSLEPGDGAVQGPILDNGATKS